VNDKIQNKLFSTNELSYPLPKPCYGGNELEKIYIFLSGLFLLGKLNLYQKKYYLVIKVFNG